MKKCPICGGKKFLITAHVTQDWKVDENENFIECTNECAEITHSPTDDDLWICSDCGNEAVGKDFNYVE